MDATAWTVIGVWLTVIATQVVLAAAFCRAQGNRFDALERHLDELFGTLDNKRWTESRQRWELTDRLNRERWELTDRLNRERWELAERASRERWELTDRLCARRRELSRSLSRQRRELR